MKREIKCMNTDERKKKDGFRYVFININFLIFYNNSDTNRSGERCTWRNTSSLNGFFFHDLSKV